jgi:hypothetical protein
VPVELPPESVVESPDPVPVELEPPESVVESPDAVDVDPVLVDPDPAPDVGFAAGTSGNGVVPISSSSPRVASLDPSGEAASRTAPAETSPAG